MLFKVISIFSSGGHLEGIIGDVLLNYFEI